MRRPLCHPVIPGHREPLPASNGPRGGHKAAQAMGFMWRGPLGLLPGDLCLSAGMGPTWQPHHQLHNHTMLCLNPNFLGPHDYMNPAGLGGLRQATCSGGGHQGLLHNYMAGL